MGLSRKPAAKGLSLIELAIVLAVAGVLGAAISSLLLNSVSTHLSAQTSARLESVAMGILELIRVDLHGASSIVAAGDTLTINSTTTYVFTGDDLTRNGTSVLPGGRLALSITCLDPGNCFSLSDDNRKIMVAGFRVSDASTQNSAVDNASRDEDGNVVKANFTVRETGFDIFTATQFD